MITDKPISPDKWDRKFMKMAKAIADDNDICLSRKIGTVLVNPETKGVLSVGYNGPARGTPHCNSNDHLMYIWTTLVTDEEKLVLQKRECDSDRIYGLREFKIKCSNTCPRRVLGFKSGQGLHLCPAVHAERNSILSAARNGIRTDGTTLYCWCCLPCSECAREIINAGVSRVVCLYSETTYDKLSHFIFNKANITVDMVLESNITEG